MKLAVACMKFFGKKLDQNLSQFMDEVRKLTESDRAELKALLERQFKEPIED